MPSAAPNTYHLINSPFASNISGFGGPIGGYDPAQPGIDPAQSIDPTAIPVWEPLRFDGLKVVAATFPGADGIDVRIPGLANSPIIQGADKRTVDYTVPFGEFGGVGAAGFALSDSDFSAAPQATVDQLVAAGHPSFSPVLQKTTALETFPIGAVTYKIDIAALDTTNDNAVNYDTLVFWDDAKGIQPGPFAAPATGPAYVHVGGTSQPFFLEGSPRKARTAFFVSSLAPDLSTVRVARYSANDIPPNAPVIADVNDVNNNVGFWRPQADFRIPEKLSPGFSAFPNADLRRSTRTRSRRSSSIRRRSRSAPCDRTPDADLGLFYIEQPDGSEHQFLLTDPRQATNPLDPNSIGSGQDAAKKARYAGYVRAAYRAANEAVQRVIEQVGTDANGVPNSNVIVVSDHGFDPFHTAVDMNAYLQSKGFNPNEVRAVTSGPAVNVYINLQGREPGGTVSRDRYLVLQKQVRQTLSDLADTNPNYTNGARSVKVFDKVFVRPAGSTSDPMFGLKGTDVIPQDGGDVMALLRTGYNFDGVQSPPVVRKGDSAPSAGARPILSVPNFYGAHGYDPNLPDMSAILFAAGPDIGHKVLPKVRNIDIAPTVNKLLGEPSASTVQGTALPLAASKGPSVSRLVLVNADNGKDVATLTEGKVLKLKDLPKHLNVRAAVSGGTGSVRFGLDSDATFRTENAAPYALFGDDNGHFRSGELKKGAHTIVATAFSDDGAGGIGGAPLTVSFTIAQ